MTESRARHSSPIRAVLRALMILGLLLLLAGLVLDFLPGSRPGIHSLQLTVIALGATLSVTGFALRTWLARGSVSGSGLLPRALLVILATGVALEILLLGADYPTYYPLDVPTEFLQPVAWWTCGEQGCHFVADAMAEACRTGAMWGRRCLVNQLGYHDSQEFMLTDADAERQRILTLGDSFTFGLSAEYGRSYVETIEALSPDALVWNTGISNTGTNQALLAFRRVAPILKPQLAIYGFYVNDFDDNLTPVDGYFVGIDEAGDTFAIQQYHVDPWGNSAKLEEQAALYYRLKGVEAPANELKRLLGVTRLGSLLLRSYDDAGKRLGIAQRAFSQRKIELTRQYLTELRQAALAQDTALLILMIPSKRDLSKPGLHFSSAISLFEELRIPYLNPVAELELARDYAPEPDAHWNSAGHQLVGALLHDCIDRYFASADFSGCERVTAPGPG